MCPQHPHHIPPLTMVVGPKEVQKCQSPPFEVIDYSGTTWPMPPGTRGHFPNCLATPPVAGTTSPNHEATSQATCPMPPVARGHFPNCLASCHLWLGTTWPTPPVAGTTSQSWSPLSSPGNILDPFLFLFSNQQLLVVIRCHRHCQRQQQCFITTPLCVLHFTSIPSLPLTSV